MYAATCSNPECPEHGIVKGSESPLRPDQEVHCGECWQLCEVTSEADLEPEPG